MTALLALLALLLGPSPSPAICLPYADQLHWVANGDMGGRAKQVVLAGDLAFVAALHVGLQVVDISDPDDIRTVGGLGDFNARDVAVVGNVACVVGEAGESGLWTVLFDPDDPGAPGGLSVIGHLEIPAGASAIVALDHRVLVTGYGGRVEVVDVSDPTAPTMVAGVSIPGHGRDIAIAGDRAYVAADFAGLVAMDISDPLEPWSCGYQTELNNAQGVAVVGTTVYVCRPHAGLFILDAADPDLITIIGSVETPDSARHVALAGRTAFVADGFPGALVAVDVADPTRPHIVGRAVTTGIALGVAVRDDRVYLAADWGGLDAFAAANPKSGEALASLELPGYATGVAGWGDLAVVAGGGDDLAVVDVADPRAPVLLGSVATPGGAANVAVSGGLAFVADGSAGLAVVDLANPAVPQLVASLPVGDAFDVALAGGIAFLVGHPDFLVVDVADPEHPALLASLAGVGGESLAVAGNRACVAGWDGLHVIDVSTPSAPTLIHTVAVPGGCEDVAIVGHLALVAGRYDGLAVVDIRTGASGGLLEVVDTAGYAMRLTIAGGVAYVADSHGVEVFDVRAPGSPVRLGNIPVPGSFAQDVAVVREAVVVANGFGGLEVLPRECGEVATGAERDGSGVGGWRRDDPAIAARPLAWASPNPTTGGTMIHLEVRPPGRVRVDVHDVAGRLVRRLISAGAATGGRRVAWDGRDEEGRPVAAGVYLARVVVGGDVTTTRIVMIR